MAHYETLTKVNARWLYVTLCLLLHVLIHEFLTCKYMYLMPGYFSDFCSFPVE